MAAKAYQPEGEWMDLSAGGTTGLLYVPQLARGAAARLVVMFHGAGQTPHSVTNVLERHAREHRFALLLPKSTRPTWDAIRGRVGPDLQAMSRLLSVCTDLTAVDPDQLSLAGFSDGASYALGVGIAFGERFGQIMAFSPGCVPHAGQATGSPGIFVSHGRTDTVLPIERTSRRLVPALLESGYRVRYHEFDGGHTVPRSAGDAAVDWLLHD
jgi:phospholipase/carboxylesterase